MREKKMLELSLGLGALVLLTFLAAIQTHLEIEEDERAGALSIARAFLLVVLAAFWISISDSLTLFSAILAGALFLIWLIQQFLGRRIGRFAFTSRLAQKADSLVSAWANLVKPLRLKTPEQLESYEQELMESVEEFSETVVREVMVPRVDIEVLDSDVTLEKALSAFISTGYSRLPVIGEDVDDVVGVLYLKDVTKVIHQNPQHLETKTAAEICRKPVFVPETKVVSELLREMQLSRTQIAMVADEYGGVAGLVSIEDLIEELVGEISDEYDREESGIEDLGNSRYRVSPRVTLDEISEHCELEIEDEDVDTVAGLLTKAVGQLPSGGEVVEIAGLELTAERVDARRGRILSVIVRKLPGDE